MENELYEQIEEGLDDLSLKERGEPFQRRSAMSAVSNISITTEHEQGISTEQEMNEPRGNFGLHRDNLDISSPSLDNLGRDAVNRSRHTASNSSPALSSGISYANNRLPFIP